MKRKNGMISEDPSAFRAVYGSKGIPDRLLSALMVAGQDMDKLTAAELAPMDELHTMDRLATIELGKLARLKDHMHVLDIGSGLGGTACLATLDPRALPPLSVDLVIENFHEKQTNAALNLIEGRIRILHILARRL
jgi:cyclopropane fatty-acyl-phospholipid synthase-like methyltransferase